MNLEKALKNLDRACKTLVPEQGRIARRNARRRVFGAMRAVRNVVETQFPAVKQTRVPKDPITAAAQRMTWRQFEYDFIKHIGLDWDPEMAQTFIDHVCTVKKIQRRELEIADLGLNYHGYCHPGYIEIHEDLVPESKWRTLLHELAHAIEDTIPARKGTLGVGSHRRRFVLALGEVYRLWVSWRKASRVAAKKRRKHEQA